MKKDIEISRNLNLTSTVWNVR